jgi:hypothetical protein
MPTVIANEIIGVQPMTGPVAQIHTLRVRYADTVPTAALATLVTKLCRRSTSPVTTRVTRTPTTPKAASTTALEGKPGNRLSIQILKEVVEAKTRKLAARWTFEAAQDARLSRASTSKPRSWPLSLRRSPPKSTRKSCLPARSSGCSDDRYLQAGHRDRHPDLRR